MVRPGLVFALFGFFAALSAFALPAGAPAAVCVPESRDSAFIPVDSWVYPAVLRLYSMGYLNSVYLGQRPWTRANVSHMLEEGDAILEDAGKFEEPSVSQAQVIFDALRRELHYDLAKACIQEEGKARVETTYTTVRVLSGTPLRDSFHLGSTIINDYGRPYENGVNNYSGLSGTATAGRFLFYARGEFRGAPSATGYSTALAENLSLNVDGIVLNPSTGLPYSQMTIPQGPINAFTKGRVLEAYISTHLLNHEISFGKQDEWLSPAQGGAMAYSNNAENIYALHINRTEPLSIPLLSRLTGPFRYEFLVGGLGGHTYIPATSGSWVSPGAPWVHVEKVSFKPTENVELGFERTAIWGGKGHEGINLHSFLRSFFSLSAPGPAVKNSSADPGARFGAFNFSYRLPYLRHWLTLYADGEVHDDVSPIDAPRRAAWRPGLYLSHVPGLPNLDLRAEAAYTDPPITTSQGGRFMYYEGIVRQGYTNNGVLFGDWIGREDKGGQAWATYHLGGNEWIQASVRNQKAAKDFISSGTTLNDFDIQAVKRLRKDLEINAKFTMEHWKAPIYLTGQQTVTATTVQLTWFPAGRLSLPR
jgi:hypothetical protein